MPIIRQSYYLPLVFQVKFFQYRWICYVHSLRLTYACKLINRNHALFSLQHSDLVFSSRFLHIVVSCINSRYSTFNSFHRSSVFVISDYKDMNLSATLTIQSIHILICELTLKLALNRTHFNTFYLLEKDTARIIPFHFAISVDAM